MEQDILKAGLQGLERKLTLLLAAHQRLKADLEHAKTENADLRQTLRTRDEQLENFKNQIKISKLAEQLKTESNEVSELKKQLDEYIREIDKCIEHVNS